MRGEGALNERGGAKGGAVKWEGRGHQMRGEGPLNEREGAINDGGGAIK